MRQTYIHINTHTHTLSSPTDPDNCTSLQNHKSAVKQNTLCPRQRAPRGRKQSLNDRRRLQSALRSVSTNTFATTHFSITTLALFECNHKCGRAEIDGKEVKGGTAGLVEKQERRGKFVCKEETYKVFPSVTQRDVWRNLTWQHAKRNVTSQQ